MNSWTLDLCGLKCPLPVLRTRKALAGLSAGERLTVLATDPLASIDIPNLVRESGDALLEQSKTNEQRVFVIEKR
jgi:tRNA 2-thiouridine synthesizing protein A